MKARVKATGEVVEVEKITSFLRDFGNGGERRYEADEVEVIAEPHSTTNWQAYRMEVAKECMANMMSFIDGRHLNDDCSRLSAWAVKMAEHINRSLEGAERRMIWLKQKTSHTHWKSAKTDSPTRSIRNWSIR